MVSPPFSRDDPVTVPAGCLQQRVSLLFGTTRVLCRWAMGYGGAHGRLAVGLVKCLFRSDFLALTLDTCKVYLIPDSPCLETKTNRPRKIPVRPPPISTPSRMREQNIRYSETAI